MKYLLGFLLFFLSCADKPKEKSGHWFNELPDGSIVYVAKGDTLDWFSGNVVYDSVNVATNYYGFRYQPDVKAVRNYYLRKDTTRPTLPWERQGKNPGITTRQMIERAEQTRDIPTIDYDGKDFYVTFHDRKRYICVPANIVDSLRKELAALKKEVELLKKPPVGTVTY